MFFGSPKKQIFRQAALDRLASPEQLDKLMRITTARGWVSLIGAILLIFAAVIWGFYGSIPTKVQGTGILLKAAGVQKIISTSSGVITDILFHADDVIRKGDLIARISQPEITSQFSEARAKLEELKTQKEIKEKFVNKNASLQLDLYQKERDRIRQLVQVSKKRKEWLMEKLSNQETLFKQGLVTRQAMLATRRDIDGIDSDLKELNNQIRQIDVKENQLKNQNVQELLSLQIQINEIKRHVKVLKERLVQRSEVKSLQTGRILEIMVSQGDQVLNGTPIMTIEPIDIRDEILEAVVYIPYEDGKKVKTSMVAGIMPSTVKKEEYGFMFAKVTNVSEFPSTYQGMMRVLENQQLVQKLSAGGTPICVRADLVRDPSTTSGYRWSSSKGPPVLITSGTACTASITIRKQRPVSLVIPILKKNLGL